MGVWSKFKAGAKWVAQKCVSAVKIIGKTVVNGVKAAAHFVGEKVKAVSDAVVAGAKKIMTKLESFVTKAKDFLHTAWTKIKEKVRTFATKAFIGAAHVLRKIGQKLQEESRNFDFNEELGTYNVTTVRRQISYEDIPPEIRAKLDEQEEYNDSRMIDDALELVS